MSESSQPDAIVAPQVLGELDAAQHQDLNESVVAQNERQAKFSERLGDIALTSEAPVVAVHVVEDSTGEKSFVVSAGANKGDTIRADRASVFGLDSPDAELAKLKDRTEMSQSEWGYFADSANILAGAIDADTPVEDVDNLTEQALSNFIISAQNTAYSPAMRTAMRLLTLGARRESFEGTGRISDIAAEGYLSESDFNQLDQTVQEIERFKKMHGFAEQDIQQQIVQSVAANIAYRPEGTYSDQLNFALNAYALGATLRMPGESGFYRQQLEEQVGR